MSVPWGALMRAALRAGISPEGFWRLSLREWRWLSEGDAGLGRSGLATLLTIYPDRAGAKNNQDKEETHDRY